MQSSVHASPDADPPLEPSSPVEKGDGEAAEDDEPLSLMRIRPESEAPAGRPSVVTQETSASPAETPAANEENSPAEVLVKLREEVLAAHEDASVEEGEISRSPGEDA